MLESSYRACCIFVHIRFIRLHLFRNIWDLYSHTSLFLNSLEKIVLLIVFGQHLLVQFWLPLQKMCNPHEMPSFPCNFKGSFVPSQPQIPAFIPPQHPYSSPPPR